MVELPNQLVPGWIAVEDFAVVPQCLWPGTYLGRKPGIGQCILKLEVGGCHGLSLGGGLIALDGEWCR